MKSPVHLASVLILPVLLLVPTLAAADDWCRDAEGWHERGYHCEVREVVLPANRPRIDVDAGKNGGISVIGWDRDEILVEAKIAAHAASDAEAADLASRVEIETAGTIEASGPQRGRRDSWWVSFRLHVPRQTNLDLEANNGGISIEGVNGELEFDTVNGGVGLTGVGGDVRGETTNGGLRIELIGDTWQGAGLEVETTNGGVTLLVPDGYSARLETGTVNGGFETDFPIELEGRIGRKVEIDLGAGGPTLRVRTTNGGVRLGRV